MTLPRSTYEQSYGNGGCMSRPCPPAHRAYASVGLPGEWACPAANGMRPTAKIWGDQRLNVAPNPTLSPRICHVPSLLDAQFSLRISPAPHGTQGTQGRQEHRTDRRATDSRTPGTPPTPASGHVSPAHADQPVVSGRTGRDRPPAHHAPCA